MKRFRWFNAEWPTSIRTLAQRIKSRSFDNDSGHGFFIDRVRDDFLEARYIEKIQYTDVVVDPYGEELKFDRIEFQQTMFKMLSSSPGLELIDPPRNVQALMNRLSEVADFGVAITPARANVLSWSTLLQEGERIISMIDSVQIGALELEPRIIAKITIKGDHQDVRTACAEFVQDKKHLVEKIQLRLASPYRGTVILSSNGSATINSDNVTEDIIPALRHALANSYI
ncbi:hypothetical protein [Aquitalea denitrificans]|uniref:hypothetical protein n=1 Tax=Aquitalea denitrificans TaxID=519081 RepID=UPI001357788C|nr:hypothetical protein [Aquitalea denitrificans]